MFYVFVELNLSFIPMHDEFKISKTKRRNAGRTAVVKCSVSSRTQKTEKGIRIGVLGASGYTGSEVQCLSDKHFLLPLTFFIYLIDFRVYELRDDWMRKLLFTVL